MFWVGFRVPKLSASPWHREVLLAGMNIAASPQLAAAVTNAGGLGVWGGVFYTPKMFRAKLKDPTC